MHDLSEGEILRLFPAAFSRLSLAARSDLAGSGVVVDLAAQAMPFDPGRSDVGGARGSDTQAGPGGLAFVLRGYLRLQQFTASGRSQIASLMIPGDLIEARNGRQDRLILETATPARLWVLRSDRAARLLARHPSFGRALSDLRAMKLARARWLADALARLSAEERIVCFLVLATRWMPYEPLSANEGVLTLDLPRQDIAHLLASSVETISRVLVRLDREGLIEIRSGQSFRLRDLSALCAEGQMAPDWRSLRFSLRPPPPVEPLTLGLRRKGAALPVCRADHDHHVNFLPTVATRQ